MTVFNGGTEKCLKIKTGRKANQIPTADTVYKITRSRLNMIIATVGVIHKFALWESGQVC